MTDRASSAPVYIIAILVMTVAAYYAASVFAPLAVALFIMALVWPLQRTLQARVHKLVALALTLLTTIAVCVAFAWIISWAVGRVGRSVVLDSARYNFFLASTKDWLDAQGVSVAALGAEHFTVAWLFSAISRLGGHLQTTFTFWLIAITYLMLGLLEVDDIRTKMQAMSNRNASRILLEGCSVVASQYRRYLLIRTGVSLLTGSLVWLFARLVGLPFAFEWGVMAFALNYLPFIGPFFATVMPTLLAMATFDTWGEVLLVFVCLNVIQFMVGSYIEPRVAGTMLSISPTLVLFVIFFWTFMWGILGTLLAMPITVAIFAFCGLNPRSQWVVELFGKPPKPA
ncbi:AI-2E family transporter [Sphingomonas daechungensis]|uniref:AI-2E family transporter n=1 Tax=Sphingomonas daechungensis TaxID=1176646 RepID=A0ABX6SZD6_9SPHN|nr:AI-2E family transporter [Sphingomonas daechungensis]QNP42328.1 AI-2E family transporter [Sphingomonas daechungensis]